MYEVTYTEGEGEEREIIAISTLQYKHNMSMGVPHRENSVMEDMGEPVFHDFESLG